MGVRRSLEHYGQRSTDWPDAYLVALVERRHVGGLVSEAGALSRSSVPGLVPAGPLRPARQVDHGQRGLQAGEVAGVAGQQCQAVTCCGSSDLQVHGPWPWVAAAPAHQAGQQLSACRVGDRLDLDARGSTGRHLGREPSNRVSEPQAHSLVVIVGVGRVVKQCPGSFA